VQYPRKAWTVDFAIGLIAKHSRSEKYYLRLARDPVDF